MKPLFATAVPRLIFDWSNLVFRAASVRAEPKDFLQLLTTMLLNYRKSFSNFNFVVAFEGAGAQHRQELLPDYKHRRKRTEEAEQLFRLAKLLQRCLGCEEIRARDGEADDAIAAYLAQRTQPDDLIVICTEDRDLWQLVKDPYRQVHSGRKKLLIDEAQVLQRTGVYPPQLGFLKALLGDKSDAVPKGVARLPVKQAVQLARVATSITTLLQALPTSCKKQVRRNYEVVKLRATLPLRTKLRNPKPKQLQILLKAYELFEFDLPTLQIICGDKRCAPK